MNDEALHISTVFNALTRSALYMGVDYNYFLINSMLSILLFIDTGNPFYALIFVPLHVVGLILCKMDPHIFRIISVRASIGRVKHARLWRCQSYEAC